MDKGWLGRGYVLPPTLQHFVWLCRQWQKGWEHWRTDRSALIKHLFSQTCWMDPHIHTLSLCIVSSHPEGSRTWRRDSKTRPQCVIPPAGSVPQQSKHTAWEPRWTCWSPDWCCCRYGAASEEILLLCQSLSGLHTCSFSTQLRSESSTWHVTMKHLSTSLLVKIKLQHSLCLSVEF